MSLPSVGLLGGIRLAGISIWLVGAAWMTFNAAIISLFTFTPDFLKTAGFSAASAGFLASAVMWPALVLSPVVGYMIDKVGLKKTIIVIGGVALAALIVLVPEATGWMLALMLLIGIAQALVPAPIFALPPEVTSPESLGLGFGIIATSQNLGIMAGPAAVGLLNDTTGSYQASYALMSVFALLIGLTMILLGLRQSQVPSTVR